VAEFRFKVRVDLGLVCQSTHSHWTARLPVVSVSSQLIAEAVDIHNHPKVGKFGSLPRLDSLSFWSDVLVYPEKVVRIVLGLDLYETLVVPTVRILNTVVALFLGKEIDVSTSG